MSNAKALTILVGSSIASGVGSVPGAILRMRAESTAAQWGATAVLLAGATVAGVVAVKALAK